MRISCQVYMFWCFWCFEVSHSSDFFQFDRKKDYIPGWNENSCKYFISHHGSISSSNHLPSHLQNIYLQKSKYWFSMFVNVLTFYKHHIHYNSIKTLFKWLSLFLQKHSTNVFWTLWMFKKCLLYVAVSYTHLTLPTIYSV